MLDKVIIIESLGIRRSRFAGGGQPEVRSCAFFIRRHVFHGGLQGTFPTRADSARPSEFQNIFAMETWPLAEHYQ